MKFRQRPKPPRRSALETRHQMGQGPSKKPERTKEEFPWSWKNRTITGYRANEVHLDNLVKHKTRDAKAKNLNRAIVVAEASRFSPILSAFQEGHENEYSGSARSAGIGFI